MAGAIGPNQKGQAKTTYLDPLPPAPLGGPLVYPAAFCFKIWTLIDKIVPYMFLLLIRPVFKFVYLSIDVEKVTLFCIISILVLLTHIVANNIMYIPLVARIGSNLILLYSLGLLNIDRKV